ncbi:hypothetical protein ACWC9T_09175 [Kitasatospora sp. NPDC001159]
MDEESDHLVPPTLHRGRAVGVAVGSGVPNQRVRDGCRVVLQDFGAGFE